MNMRSMVWLAVVLLASGCAKDPLQAKQAAIYGVYYPDHEHISKLILDMKAVRAGSLSAEDEERLFRLKAVDHEISNYANAALGCYAQANPRLYRRLQAAVPGDLASPSAYHVWNALQMSDWVKAPNVEPQLRAAQVRLASKSNRNEVDGFVQQLLEERLAEAKTP